MKTAIRRTGIVVAAAAIALTGFAGTALAGGGGGGGHDGSCNSGRGNGSETVPESDCDPGNSGANNNGGD